MQVIECDRHELEATLNTLGEKVISVIANKYEKEEVRSYIKDDYGNYDSYEMLETGKLIVTEYLVIAMD